MNYYLGMIAITACWSILEVRPKGIGEWAAFIALCLLWPIAMAYSVYCAIRLIRSDSGRLPEGENAEGG